MRVHKTTSLSLVTVLAVTAAALTVSFPTAGASTMACGNACTSPSVDSLGTSKVLAASGSSAGSSVVMAAASTTNSEEDWTPELQQQTVAQAAADGVVSSRLAFNYGIDQLLEFQYAPNGKPSDLCLADTSSDAPVNDFTPPVNVPTQSVAIEPCGMTAASLWILDENTETIESNGYTDLINAGYAAEYTYLAPSTEDSSSFTSPFAEPEVLTVNSSGNVVLAPLSELGTVVSSSQLWTSWSSPTNAAVLRAKIAKAHFS
jgi:hypothetical protein